MWIRRTILNQLRERQPRPNTDATGKPSTTGAGGIGYDDMVCGDGESCGGSQDHILKDLNKNKFIAVGQGIYFYVSRV